MGDGIDGFGPVCGAEAALSIDLFATPLLPLLLILLLLLLLV